LKSNPNSTICHQLLVVIFVRIQSLKAVIHRIKDRKHACLIPCVLLLIRCMASASMTDTNTPPVASLQKSRPLDMSPAVSTNWIPLLDAGLTHWEVWMGVPHHSVTGLPPGTPVSLDGYQGTPLGLNNDPKHVFTVRMEAGEPVLCISGEIFGGLTTVEAYSNYHFRAQFKWGTRKWEPKLNVPRDNGILFDCTGPHSAFWNVWKRCLEFQVEEKNMGDLYLLSGTIASVPVVKGAKDWHYDSGGALNTFGQPLVVTLDCGGAALHSVKLHYRHVNQAECWQSVELERNGASFQGEIPAAYTARRYALQYYFEIAASPAEATLFPPLAADLANVPYFVLRRTD
jgi:hypothetical protein